MYQQRQPNYDNITNGFEHNRVEAPQAESTQRAQADSPGGTVCLLIFNQAIAEALSQNLNACGQKAVVVKPDDAETFLKENRSNISLAVLDPRISSQGPLVFVDLLNLIQIPYVLIDSIVRSMYLAKALKDNARGYLTYDCSLDSLLDTISKVASGDIKHYWCPKAAEMIDYSGKKPKVKSANALSSLTERQLEVLTHLAEGKTVKEVAHILHLSHKSVDSHKYRIMNRLHVHDRVHLSRFAIREGLIEP